jgi:DnaJ-class molecular chaperone
MWEANRSTGNGPWQVGVIVPIIVALIGAGALIWSSFLSKNKDNVVTVIPAGVCDVCLGVGFVPDTEICKQCKGEGKTICVRCDGSGTYVNQFGARFDCERTQRCELCLGLGKIIKGYIRCPKCSDTGRKQKNIYILPRKPIGNNRNRNAARGRQQTRKAGRNQTKHRR